MTGKTKIDVIVDRVSQDGFQIPDDFTVYDNNAIATLGDDTNTKIGETVDNSLFPDKVEAEFERYTTIKDNINPNLRLDDTPYVFGDLQNGNVRVELSDTSNDSTQLQAFDGETESNRNLLESLLTDSSGNKRTNVQLDKNALSEIKLATNGPDKKMQLFENEPVYGDYNRKIATSSLSINEEIELALGGKKNKGNLTYGEMSQILSNYTDDEIRAFYNPDIDSSNQPIYKINGINNESLDIIKEASKTRLYNGEDVPKGRNDSDYLSINDEIQAAIYKKKKGETLSEQEIEDILKNHSYDEVHAFYSPEKKGKQPIDYLDAANDDTKKIIKKIATNQLNNNAENSLVDQMNGLIENAEATNFLVNDELENPLINYNSEADNCQRKEEELGDFHYDKENLLNSVSKALDLSTSLSAAHDMISKYQVPTIEDHPEILSRSYWLPNTPSYEPVDMSKIKSTANETNSYLDRLQTTSNNILNRIIDITRAVGTLDPEFQEELDDIFKEYIRKNIKGFTSDAEDFTYLDVDQFINNINRMIDDDKLKEYGLTVGETNFIRLLADKSKWENANDWEKAKQYGVFIVVENGRAVVKTGEKIFDGLIGAAGLYIASDLNRVESIGYNLLKYTKKNQSSSNELQETEEKLAPLVDKTITITRKIIGFDAVDAFDESMGATTMNTYGYQQFVGSGVGKGIRSQAENLVGNYAKKNPVIGTLISLGEFYQKTANDETVSNAKWLNGNLIYSFIKPAIKNIPSGEKPFLLTMYPNVVEDSTIAYMKGTDPFDTPKLNVEKTINGLVQKGITYATEDGSDNSLIQTIASDANYIRGFKDKVFERIADAGPGNSSQVENFASFVETVINNDNNANDSITSDGINASAKKIVKKNDN